VCNFFKTKYPGIGNLTTVEFSLRTALRRPVDYVCGLDFNKQQIAYRL